MESRRQDWTTYEGGDFYDRYGGRQAILKRREGIVIVWVSDDFDSRGRQLIDCETIIEGRTHRLWQRRTPSEAVTEQGAKRVATRWLREVAAQPTEGEGRSEETE